MDDKTDIAGRIGKLIRRKYVLQNIKEIENVKDLKEVVFSFGKNVIESCKTNPEINKYYINYNLKQITDLKNIYSRSRTFNYGYMLGLLAFVDKDEIKSYNPNEKFIVSDEEIDPAIVCNLTNIDNLNSDEVQNKRQKMEKYVVYSYGLDKNFETAYGYYSLDYLNNLAYIYRDNKNLYYGILAGLFVVNEVMARYERVPIEEKLARENGINLIMYKSRYQYNPREKKPN